jgi:hypothetical protein
VAHALRSSPVFTLDLTLRDDLRFHFVSLRLQAVVCAFIPSHGWFLPGVWILVS